MLTSVLTRTAKNAVRRAKVVGSSSSFLTSPFSTARSDVDDDPPRDNTTLLEEDISNEGEWAGCSRRFMNPLQISVRGSDILTDPLYNKGTAFKQGERDRLRFRGLLPPRISNMPVQKERFLLALRSEESMIRRHLMLEDLHDRNETLYHRVLVSTSYLFASLDFAVDKTLLHVATVHTASCQGRLNLSRSVLGSLIMMYLFALRRWITLKKWRLSFTLQRLVKPARNLHHNIADLVACTLPMPIVVTWQPWFTTGPTRMCM